MSTVLKSEYGIMNKDRKGKAILTYTGISFWPIDPDPKDIDINDIAHALSMQCRFNGHIKKFYSVAEHCVRVSAICPENLALYGLLHDASEAYLSDIPTPLKSELPNYKQYEAVVQGMVYTKYGLLPEEPLEVKDADKIMLVTEMRDLLIHADISSIGIDPLNETINPWSQEFAEQAFLDCFYALVD
jgi:hypothetical protein